MIEVHARPITRMRATTGSGVTGHLRVERGTA